MDAAGLPFKMLPSILVQSAAVNAVMHDASFGTQLANKIVSVLDYLFNVGDRINNYRMGKEFSEHPEKLTEFQTLTDVIFNALENSANNDVGENLLASEHEISLMPYGSGVQFTLSPTRFNVSGGKSTQIYVQNVSIEGLRQRFAHRVLTHPEFYSQQVRDSVHANFIVPCIKQLDDSVTVAGLRQQLAQELALPLSNGAKRTLMQIAQGVQLQRAYKRADVEGLPAFKMLTQMVKTAERNQVTSFVENAQPLLQAHLVLNDPEGYSNQESKQVFLNIIVPCVEEINKSKVPVTATGLISLVSAKLGGAITEGAKKTLEAFVASNFPRR